MSSQTDSHLLISPGLNLSQEKLKSMCMMGVSTIAGKQRCIGNAQWRMVAVGAESRSLNNLSDRLEK